MRKKKIGKCSWRTSKIFLTESLGSIWQKLILTWVGEFLIFLNKARSIDTVIHCMGGGLGIKADLISEKDFLKLLMVNLICQSEINNFLIKKMIKNKIKGNILHVSSVAGLESTASIGYSCAKAALTVYSKKLAKAFIKNNILSFLCGS